MAGDNGPRRTGAFSAHVPHAPRIWNYWLGGKDNFAADREVGDRMARMYPDIVELARADRAFLGRAVRYLIKDAGIRQFLDIGTGLPTASNTHEVAQGLAPESRVVYVDNDHRLPGSMHVVGSPEGSSTRDTRRRVRTGQHRQPG